MDDRGNRFRLYDPWEGVKEEEKRDKFGRFYYVKKGPFGTRKESFDGLNKIVETTNLLNGTKTVEKIDRMTDKVISSERKLRDIFSGEDDED